MFFKAGHRFSLDIVPRDVLFLTDQKLNEAASSSLMLLWTRNDFAGILLFCLGIMG